MPLPREREKKDNYGIRNEKKKLFHRHCSGGNKINVITHCNDYKDDDDDDNERFVKRKN